MKTECSCNVSDKELKELCNKEKLRNPHLGNDDILWNVIEELKR